MPQSPPRAGDRAPLPQSQDCCEFCGGDSIFVKYDFGQHHILRCRGCTLMWLNPQPTPAELREIYSFDYYRNREFFSVDNDNENVYGYHDYFSERFIKQQDHQPIIRRLVQWSDADPDAGGGRFLDVGCGLGYLLDVAHDHGFHVEGIDCNPAAAEWIAAKFKFPVFCGDFMAYEGQPFDAVAMLDVIEHLPRPFEALAKAASLVRPGGLFVLSTMDSDSFVSRLIGKRLEDFRRTREHLYFFNRRTIRAALERAGFEILRIDSYGLTIQLDFLMARARLAFPLLGGVPERLVQRLGLAGLRFHFDPRTKMIVYARLS